MPKHLPGIKYNLLSSEGMQIRTGPNEQVSGLQNKTPHLQIYISAHSTPLRFQTGSEEGGGELLHFARIFCKELQEEKISRKDL